MATKAERARYEEERKPKKTGASSGKAATTKGKAKAKAKTPRRSRASRIKGDTNLNLREEMVKGSPEQRARKSAARGKRPRGSR